jgi:soluble lytic murein transglycosylase-like protein
MERRRLYSKKVLHSAVGAFAVGISLLTPAEASAQLIDPRPPGEIGPKKPKVSPLLVPQPVTDWVEPNNLDHLIDIASSEMGIPSSYARKIVMCESEGDPNKINPTSGARGLWQIMPIHAEEFIKMGWDYWRDWSNGYRNTRAAVRIKQKQGLSAWDCS